jgi:hypothetical protein
LALRVIAVLQAHQEGAKGGMKHVSRENAVKKK